MILLFDYVTTINKARCDRWHEGTEPWVGSDWSNAMQGEAGEAGNVVKKLRRIETGVVGRNDDPKDVLLVKLAEEIADTFLYLDLLATYYGIDLPQAIVDKFNAVSEREGFAERLVMQGPVPTAMQRNRIDKA